MTEQEKYKYHFRPGYGSQNLLIEFYSGIDNDCFMNDLLGAISEINPKLIDFKDIWVNDEILLEIESDVGSFSLSKDTWGFAFIMADENQDGLKTINSILVNDSRFEKVEVNFDNYKTTRDF